MTSLTNVSFFLSDRQADRGTDRQRVRQLLSILNLEHRNWIKKIDIILIIIALGIYEKT